MMDDKLLSDLNKIVKVQGAKGHWDYDEYMHGMYNGMESILSKIELREPKFRSAPEKFGYQKKEERRIKKRKRTNDGIQ